MLHITRVSTYYARRTAVLDAKRDIQFAWVMEQVMGFKSVPHGLARLTQRAANKLDECGVPQREWGKN